MSAIIIRRQEGDVLISKNLSVDKDGVVSVNARFLRGSGFSLDGNFVGSQTIKIGDPWDFDVFGGIENCPTLQAPLTVESLQGVKQNGLLYVDALYKSAALPVVINRSRSVEKLSVSHFENIGDASVSVSFDYYTRTETLSCVIAKPYRIKLEPFSTVLSTFNFQQNVSLGSDGTLGGVQIQFTPVIYYSVDQEIIGNTARISCTAKTIIEAGSPETQQPPEINPWIEGQDTFNSIPLI